MRLTRLLLAAVVALPATAIAQPSTVILVRHAERATEPPNDPVLTEAGQERARALAAVLADAKVTSIITTHLQRTQLTAKPLGDAVGLSPIVVRASGAGHVDSVAATVKRQPSGSVVLVAGHSNTIPRIIAALGGPSMPDLCETQYSMLYVLEFAAGGGAPRLIKANYGAAAPPNADNCPRM